MQQQPNRNTFEEDMKVSSNILMLLVNAHVSCITMFIRHSFGSNMPGITGVVSAIMLFLVTAGQEDGVFFWYMITWFMALCCQRAWTAKLASQCKHEHSYYAGWPWLALLGGIKNEMAAKKIEPALCVFIGLMLMPLSPVLGGFVMFGCVTLTILLLSDVTATRRQVTAMRDLQIEQRQMAERMRGMRDDF